MSFPQMRLGIEAKEPKPGEIMDCNDMRRAIFEATYESPLIRNAMMAADYRGASAEDRYTMLAYHALVALETYYKQALKIAMLYPDPMVLLKDPK